MALRMIENSKCVTVLRQEWRINFISFILPSLYISLLFVSRAPRWADLILFPKGRKRIHSPCQSKLASAVDSRLAQRSFQYAARPFVWYWYCGYCGRFPRSGPTNSICWICMIAIDLLDGHKRLITVLYDTPITIIIVAKWLRIGNSITSQRVTAETGFRTSWSNVLLK